MQTALGFRTHSGWAAAVTIGLSPEGPVVCDRRMIVLADAETPGSKQPYHTAEPMPLPKAKEFLKKCVDFIGVLGKTVGPPWSEDQKLAALSAWTALASTSAKKKKAAVQKA